MDQDIANLNTEVGDLRRQNVFDATQRVVRFGDTFAHCDVVREHYSDFPMCFQCQQYQSSQWKKKGHEQKDLPQNSTLRCSFENNVSFNEKWRIAEAITKAQEDGKDVRELLDFDSWNPSFLSRSSNTNSRLASNGSTPGSPMTDMGAITAANIGLSESSAGK